MITVSTLISSLFIQYQWVGIRTRAAGCLTDSLAPRSCAVCACLCVRHSFHSYDAFGFIMRCLSWPSTRKGGRNRVRFLRYPALPPATTSCGGPPPPKTRSQTTRAKSAAGIDVSSLLWEMFARSRMARLKSAYIFQGLASASVTSPRPERALALVLISLCTAPVYRCTTDTPRGASSRRRLRHSDDTAAFDAQYAAPHGEGRSDVTEPVTTTVPPRPPSAPPRTIAGAALLTVATTPTTFVSNTPRTSSTSCSMRGPVALMPA